MRYFIMILTIGAIVSFADDLSIDNLLQQIQKHEDLSQKTRLENSGLSYVFTQDDLRRMQAYTLKDILKSVYPIGYNENVFGIPDPLTANPYLPFSSNRLKIYLDNQEINGGLYGSGIIIYGDMDIGNIDHIEVYVDNPTYSNASESAAIVVKLFSKTADRNEGGDIKIFGGSFWKKGIHGGYGYKLENGWNGYLYLSGEDRNRKRYHHKHSTLSRDSRNLHLFTSVGNEKHHIVLDAITQKRDSFLNLSILATPDRSEIEGTNLHLGYQGNWWGVQVDAAYDRMETDTHFKDAQARTIALVNALTHKNIVYQYRLHTFSDVYTLGIKQKFTIGNHHFMGGGYYRYKHFRHKDVVYNEISYTIDHDEQAITSLFLEDQYHFGDRTICTAGINYQYITNGSGYQKDHIFNTRVGLTHTTDAWVFKTALTRWMVPADPYYIGNKAYVDITKRLDPETDWLFSQSVKYQYDPNNEWQLKYTFMKVEDALAPLGMPIRLENLDQPLFLQYLLGSYQHHLSLDDKIEITPYITHIRLAEKIAYTKRSFYFYNLILRSFNHYENFDIFNELLLYKRTSSGHFYADYTAGIIYTVNDNLSVAIKGNNILGKAPKTAYPYLDSLFDTHLNKLEISPFDREFTISVEYLF